MYERKRRGLYSVLPFIGDAESVAAYRGYVRQADARASGFGLRVSGLGVRVLDFGFLASGLGFRVWGFGLGGSGWWLGS